VPPQWSKVSSYYRPPPTTEAIMRVVGYLTTAVVALGTVAFVVLIVGSLPDIRRYLRLSRM
jgi:hypothetical protein